MSNKLNSNNNNIYTQNMNKQKLGQFYTTNYEHILSNMTIPTGTHNIIEPFVGNGDLLKFIKNKENYELEIYDIDPKCKNAIKRNTLKNPPDYAIMLSWHYADSIVKNLKKKNFKPKIIIPLPKIKVIN